MNYNWVYKFPRLIGIDACDGSFAEREDDFLQVSGRENDIW